MWGWRCSRSAAAAAQAGVSVEDTIALLTELGRAGLRGSDAGTSLQGGVAQVDRAVEARRRRRWTVLVSRSVTNRGT